MNEQIQASDRSDEPDPIPASAQPGGARRPDRVRPAGRPSDGAAGDDGPDSDESGGPTAPQRPPADS